MSKIQQDIPLSSYSNFKIGGLAKYFLEVFSKEDLIEGLKEWHEISKDLPAGRQVFVLGGGTNVVFSDNLFNGLVIKNSINLLEKNGEEVTVGAGVLFSKLTDFCIDNSLSGLEWAGGLPGTVGGAVRGNAGAYGGETKDNILEVKSIDLNTLTEKTRTGEDCYFNYRTSVFKIGDGENEIITIIKLNLKAGNKEEIKKLTQEKIDARIKRHPLEYPNVGSIFKNVPVEKFTQAQMEELSQYIKNDPFPVVPTAKINFLTGLSGKRVGDAQLSEKHTNFIVNLGNATSKDVHELIKIIKDEVYQKFNINLEEEVMFVD